MSNPPTYDGREGIVPPSYGEAVEQARLEDARRVAVGYVAPLSADGATIRKRYHEMLLLLDMGYKGLVMDELFGVEESRNRVYALQDASKYVARLKADGVEIPIAPWS